MLKFSSLCIFPQMVYTLGIIVFNHCMILATFTMFIFTLCMSMQIRSMCFGNTIGEKGDQFSTLVLSTTVSGRAHLVFVAIITTLYDLNDIR